MIPSTTTTSDSPWKLSLSSPSLVVGKSVTITGTGCPNATEVDPHGQLGAVLTPAGSLSASTNGDWSQTFVVGEQFVGSGSLTATCVENGPLGKLGASEVSYPPVSVTITTPHELRVSPSGPVTPGTSLSVSSTGAGCPAYNVPVVTLDPLSAAPPAQIPSPGPTTIYGPQSRSETPSWTVSLPIAQATAPGEYVVRGFCLSQYFETVSRSFQPAALTIS